MRFDCVDCCFDVVWVEFGSVKEREKVGVCYGVDEFGVGDVVGYGIGDVGKVYVV